MKTATTLAFQAGEQVKVRGTDEEVLNLYGRELVGAVGVIVKPARRSQGHNRYLVHVPKHTYMTLVKRMERPIAALDVVLREEHIERVVGKEVAQ